MTQKWLRRLPLLTVLILSAYGGLQSCDTPGALNAQELQDLYATPLPAPQGPLAVYFLGHSSVGRDMPAMLDQLSGPGHRHNSQLGRGTSLKAHWEPKEEILGFAEENNHPKFRSAKISLASGDYGAVILTEMGARQNALSSDDRPAYLARWANLARRNAPDVRLYLFETWQSFDDPAGALDGPDQDLTRSWDDHLLLPAMAHLDPPAPIYVIPAGQVMARLVKEVEARGGVGNLRDRTSLFAKQPSGAPDLTHLNDLGAYLVALTHYAVLYQLDPTGFPYNLKRADGTPADAPGPEAARLMQEVVWQVVTNTPRTGLAQRP